MVQGDDSKIRGFANISSLFSKVTKGKTTTLTLTSSTINVRSDGWDNKERFPGTITNEGANAQDARDADKNDREHSKWDKEYTSLEAASLVMEKLHPDKSYDFQAGRVYDPSWKATDRDANRDKAIRHVLEAPPKDGGYGLKAPKGKKQP